MKWIAYIMLIFLAIKVNGKLLSLLNQFDMAHPLIIGKHNDIKTKEMFHLMKDVMNLNQTISMITKFRNDSLLNIPGVMINPDRDTISDFHHKNICQKLQKPWVIIGQQIHKYSQIDEPLYYLKNGLLFEHYEFKSLRRTNVLGQFNNNEFVWNENIKTNLFERRGNFENLTLIGVTEHDRTFTDFPPNLVNVSTIVPKTVEVCTLCIKISQTMVEFFCHFRLLIWSMVRARIFFEYFQKD